MRKRFSDILAAKQISVSNEYERLFKLFRLTAVTDGSWSSQGSVYYYCEKYFLNFSASLRGTCVSLSEFNNQYRFNFPRNPVGLTIDDLINLCEYTYNLSVALKGCCSLRSSEVKIDYCAFYNNQIEYLIEQIGYVPNTKDGIVDFVPKNPAAIAVAEIIDEDLAYDVIEYNHHSMRGDLLAKKTTLLRFANLLEPKRAELKTINEKLSVNIFFMFNNLDLRHNNSTSGDKNYQQYTEQMSKADLEAWYDELYQMCLLAFLELDNIERAKNVDTLKKNYKS